MMANKPKTTSPMDAKVIDIGINLTNRAFRSSWKEVVHRAIDAGVKTLQINI